MQSKAMGRNCPYPGLGCGPFWCQRAGHALYEDQGERSWLIAWAKMSALGQLEARYRRMRRVLRVTTAASLSSLMRSVSTWAHARAVPCKASAQPLDQHIAQRGQQHAQLIALQVLATRAGCKQAHLRFFDAVLGLPALAVHIVVQCLGLARQIGHHVARVGALCSPYSSRVITRRSRCQLCAA